MRDRHQFFRTERTIARIETRSGTRLGRDVKFETLRDRLKKNLRCKRLLQEEETRLIHCLVAQDRTRITTGIDNPQIRPYALQALSQFPARYPFRHHHIGQQQIEITARFLPDLEGLNTRCSLPHPKTVPHEKLSGKFPQIMFVIHEKN